MDLSTRPDAFAGKRVVVLGLSATASDILSDVIPHAAHPVYASHRRGAIPLRRFRNGIPTDAIVNWRRRNMTQLLQAHFPRVLRVCGDLAVNWISKRTYPDMKPEWRILPIPSITLKVPAAMTLDSLFPCLEDGRLKSVHGIKQFLGPKEIELLDGTVLEDIDAVIMCTGYKADFSVADGGAVETSVPTACGYDKAPGGGAPMHRLWMNMFPPKYADSLAMLCYSAFGKSNGFSFADVTSMAVSHAFSGVQPLPTAGEMERWVDEHQAWVASQWSLEPTVDLSMVKQWEFQGWLHEAAGTGMENLSAFGWKGWKFWWKDPKMYNLMANGIESAHIYKYFETDKRKAWDGAKEAILKLDEEWRRTMPVTKEQEKEWVKPIEKAI